MWQNDPYRLLPLILVGSFQLVYKANYVSIFPITALYTFRYLDDIVIYLNRVVLILIAKGRQTLGLLSILQILAHIHKIRVQYHHIM